MMQCISFSWLVNFNITNLECKFVKKKSESPVVSMSLLIINAKLFVFLCILSRLNLSMLSIWKRKLSSFDIYKISGWEISDIYALIKGERIIDIVSWFFSKWPSNIHHWQNIKKKIFWKSLTENSSVYTFLSFWVLYT